MISPSTWIWPSLLSFLFLPLLLLNVAFVVVWILLRRWECLLSVAVIAVRWSFVSLFFQIGGTKEAPTTADQSTTLSVMTYNVHLFQGRDAEVGISDSIAQCLLKMVDQHSPDMLCLQEYAAPHTVALTDSLYNRGYQYSYGAHYSSKGLPYGTVVFSRLRYNFVKTLDSEKILIEADKSGNPFRVVCVHMDSYSFSQSDKAEIEQVRHGKVDESFRPTLRKVKGTILRHEEGWSNTLKPVVLQCTTPLIVVGDMNDTPASYLYHQFSKHLTDAFIEQGAGTSATYNGGFPRFRIDMVFHNDGFKALSYCRIKSDASDHYPVLVSLSLTGK
ncbi:MAG: endonuclease/exonuclease/phosphatase family protein [Bacteroidales bacterium]|nr:endonuclease/exonuclease/phosphatase family protein [Bacteroidales bacterium]